MLYPILGALALAGLYNATKSTPGVGGTRNPTAAQVLAESNAQFDAMSAEDQIQAVHQKAKDYAANISRERLLELFDSGFLTQEADGVHINGEDARLEDMEFEFEGEAYRWWTQGVDVLPKLDSLGLAMFANRDNNRFKLVDTSVDGVGGPFRRGRGAPGPRGARAPAPPMPGRPGAQLRRGPLAPPPPSMRATAPLRSPLAAPAPLRSPGLPTRPPMQGRPAVPRPVMPVGPRPMMAPPIMPMPYPVPVPMTVNPAMVPLADYAADDGYYEEDYYEEDYQDYDGDGDYGDQGDATNSPAAAAATQYTYKMDRTGVPGQQIEVLGNGAAAVVPFAIGQKGDVEGRYGHAEWAATANGVKTALVTAPGRLGVAFVTDVAAGEDALAEDGWVEIHPTGPWP